MIYNSYSDPSHGWAKVTRAELERLKIADKITHYSYQRGEHVYLEEDGDLSTFVKAKEAAGEVCKFRTFNSNKSSKIRSYDSYASDF